MKEMLKKKLTLLLLCINIAFLSSCGKEQVNDSTISEEDFETYSLDTFMEKILSIVDCDDESNTLYLNNLVRPNVSVAYLNYGMCILYDDNDDHYLEKIDFLRFNC